MKKFNLSSIRRWDDFPHVILAKELKTQPWYKTIRGNTEFDISKITYESLKSRSINRKPDHLTVAIPYKTENGTIQVGWNEVWQRFTVSVENPNIEKYRWGSKTFDSASIKGALSRIKTAYEDMIPVLEKKSVLTQEKLARKKEDIEHCAKLTKDLNVEIHPQNLIYKSFTYKNGQTYGATFTFLDNDKKDLYRIDHILGQFNKEDIKKIIEVISSSREAVASRLLG